MQLPLPLKQVLLWPHPADVLVDDAFAEQRESFCRANCHHFEVRRAWQGECPAPPHLVLLAAGCAARRAPCVAARALPPCLARASHAPPPCWPPAHPPSPTHPHPPTLPPTQPGEENKLVYTELFARYTALVEAGVAAGLAAALPGFDMESFLALVDAHQEELGAEVGWGWWGSVLLRRAAGRGLVRAALQPTGVDRGSAPAASTCCVR